MNVFKKLRLLYLASRLYRKLKEGIKMKKWLEREWILTVLGIIASIWGAVQGLIPADLSAKIVAGIIMVFAIARAIVKFTATTKDDEILAKIEEIFKKK